MATSELSPDLLQIAITEASEGIAESQDVMLSDGTVPETGELDVLIPAPGQPSVAGVIEGDAGSVEDTGPPEGVADDADADAAESPTLRPLTGGIALHAAVEAPLSESENSDPMAPAEPLAEARAAVPKVAVGSVAVTKTVDPPIVKHVETRLVEPRTVPLPQAGPSSGTGDDHRGQNGREAPAGRHRAPDRDPAKTPETSGPGRVGPPGEPPDKYPRLPEPGEPADEEPDNVEATSGHGDSDAAEHTGSERVVSRAPGGRVSREDDLVSGRAAEDVDYAEEDGSNREVVISEFLQTEFANLVSTAREILGDTVVQEQLGQINEALPGQLIAATEGLLLPRVVSDTVMGTGVDLVRSQRKTNDFVLLPGTESGQDQLNFLPGMYLPTDASRRQYLRAGGSRRNIFIQAHRLSRNIPQGVLESAAPAEEQTIAGPPEGDFISYITGGPGGFNYTGSPNRGSVPYYVTRPVIRTAPGLLLESQPVVAAQMTYFITRGLLQVETSEDELTGAMLNPRNEVTYLVTQILKATHAAVTVANRFEVTEDPKIRRAVMLDYMRRQIIGVDNFTPNAELLRYMIAQRI